MKERVRASILLLVIFVLLLPACDTIEDVVDEGVIAVEQLVEGEDWEAGDPEVEAEELNEPDVSEPEVLVTRPPAEPLPEGLVISKWDLWNSDQTMLRGANIWQAVVEPDLDGDTFKGSGPVGPPYSQTDFNHMAELGANYVTISGPGLFSEQPPFTPDMEVVTYLDDLLKKIANADMFATISFRTGPGRSEYSLCCEGDRYYKGYFNDTIWEEQTAQDAWVEMWRYTAERYRDNPVVVGYKLMVEPNASDVLLDMYEPEEFHPQYSGSLYDWNQLHPRIVTGIREVDPETPILLGADGYSSVLWLPYLEPVDAQHVVYVVHQYEPVSQYTDQEPDGKNSYPGQFDTDWDGQDDQFNRDWLENNILTVMDAYSAKVGAPMGVDEFGVQRWVPGADVYMNDIMGLFEERGINYSLWEWQTSWPDFAEEIHPFNFRFGSDPDSRSETESALQDVIMHYWNLNVVRPSNVPW
jgi:hypothetical protein